MEDLKVVYLLFQGLYKSSNPERQRDHGNGMGNYNCTPNYYYGNFGGFKVEICDYGNAQDLPVGGRG